MYGLNNEQGKLLPFSPFGMRHVSRSPMQLISPGSNGEDVKEMYYYLDSTPTHSYMKFLYKYPQATFPYDQLLEENRNRSREVGEFELMDTDVFDEDRYWDVFVEVSVWSAPGFHESSICV